MIKVDITHNGFYFSVEYNGRPLHFKEWDATDNCIYYMPLSTLVDNGLATYDKNACHVPFDSCYFISREDMDILGIPPYYRNKIRLRSEGDFKSPDLKYVVEYLTHFPDGDLIPAYSIGNVVIINEYNRCILTDKQYKLIKLVEHFNAVNDEYKTLEYNLRCFAEIKRAALQADVYLDDYLANEDVFAPTEIRLELGREGDALTILPSVDIKEKEKFTSTFDRQRRILDVYPVQDENGHRTRVVLTPEQKENLRPIKEHRCRYEGEEQILQMIEHPTEYFDPDQFDLSAFYSDRVIDLGFYKPKFYPFVSPYKSQWIAGATIEHPQNGTSNITIHNEEELAELRNSIEEAKQTESRLVDYNETSIALPDAEFLEEMATKQLEHPNTPIKIEKDENDKRVLIIEENAEDAGYVEKTGEIGKQDKYILYRNNNLSEGFSLKEHQEEGVAWLQHLLMANAPGCLMADDMGLGKTLQILYFIDWHAQTHPLHNPYLIVAPVSLLENWQNEYARFFKKKMCVSIFSGRDIPRKFDPKAIERLQKSEIVLTNYETIRNSQLNFCATDFDIVVLDEAQKIKTPGTLVTNAAKALKGRFKVAMTGTPVENTLLDLWCIMDFCVPGLLDSARSFARKYQTPLKNSDTDLVQLGNEIHEKLGIYFIRRLKSDAAKDLPQKIEVKKNKDMPVVQETYYRQAIAGYNGDKGQMLQIIMNIREISEHPYLHDHSIPNHDTNELIANAARLIVTMSFLDQIKAREEKVIIFAERKETQSMLQHIIRTKYGFSPKIINGDTPASALQNNGKQTRQGAIDEFQSRDGFGVIIMSPVAAGMGLNVTAANHVIHFSRHWNPAKENQATDRAYRIGQEKDVYVYYPIATSQSFKSFDLTLDELLTRKSNLATSTIFPTERVEVKPEEFEQMLNI